MQFLLPAGRDPIEVGENSVAYTGTHDNDTSRRLVGADDRRRARPRARAPRAPPGSTRTSRAGCSTRLALASQARTAIVPVQDLLGLDNSARMNTPGREDGNWAFRLEPGALDDALAARLRAATRAAGR